MSSRPFCSSRGIDQDDLPEGVKLRPDQTDERVKYPDLSRCSTFLNSKIEKPRYNRIFLRGNFMFDQATTTLLRVVLDEVCASVSLSETGARTHVASKILDMMDKSVSIGIARMQDCESIENLVGRTDAVLYKAKHQGRGQFFSDEENEFASKAS